MLNRMGRKFDLLVSRKRDMPERHATLHACLEWSYRLLPEGLRGPFGALSVFRSGWTLDAAEAVLATDDALGLLHELRSRSLITADASGDEARYGMLESLRGFAELKLSEADRLAVERRHAVYFAALAAQAEPELAGGGQILWLPVLTLESANLREALAWSFRNDAPQGAAMARRLGRFWIVKGRWSEGREWLGRAATAGDALGDATGQGAALCLSGPMAAYEGDAQAARDLVDRGVELLRKGGETLELARGLVNAGVVCQALGELDAARRAYEEGRTIADRTGHASTRAAIMGNLAGVAFLAGDLVGAEALADEALALATRLGDQWLCGMLLLNLGDISCEVYDAEAARSRYCRALQHLGQAGDVGQMARALRQLAAVQAYGSDFSGAATLLGAASAAQDRAGRRLDPEQQADLDATVADVRQSLAVAPYEKAWEAGLGMDAGTIPDWVLRRRRRSAPGPDPS